MAVGSGTSTRDNLLRRVSAALNLLPEGCVMTGLKSTAWPLLAVLALVPVGLATSALAAAPADTP